jgi:REP element-mobilizing transposase RayT
VFSEVKLSEQREWSRNVAAGLCACRIGRNYSRLLRARRTAEIDVIARLGRRRDQLLLGQAMTFQPLDHFQTVHCTRRNLPHWQQAGSTYFVTFRLADSLPVAAKIRLRELQSLNSEEALPWIERFLDAGRGKCCLGDPANAEVVATSVKHFDGTRYHLGRYVVMPNHVHAIVQPILGNTLSSVVHGWKSYSAHVLRSKLRVSGAFWQEETFDRLIRNETELQRYHDYIQANPCVAGLKTGDFVAGQGLAEWPVR